MTAAERADAERLIDLCDERIALTRAFANHPQPTGAMADAILAKSDELDAACEKFRRRYYPRRHRVFVGLSAVMTASRTGRSIRRVLEREACS